MQTLRLWFAPLFGLAVGSFLNVCITRLPAHASVVTPRSRCPSCKAPIAARDNIPVLSFMLLRGRCRGCHQPISPRYPLVEAGTAALFLLCALAFRAPLEWIGFTIFCSLLLALLVTDAEMLLLPDALTGTGLLLGLVYRFLVDALDNEGSLVSGLIGVGRASLSGLLAAAVMLAIGGLYRRVRRRTGLGAGDAKLLAMIAVWTGARIAGVVFFLGVVSAAGFGLVLLWMRRSRRSSRADLPAAEPLGQSLRLPFGSFLAGAALYSVFFGTQTLFWYLSFFH